MKEKYIIFTDGTHRVFSCDNIHSYMTGGKEVLSAGFFDGEHTFGESGTLGVKSRPEDAIILKRNI